MHSGMRLHTHIRAFQINGAKGAGPRINGEQGAGPRDHERELARFEVRKRSSGPRGSPLQAGVGAVGIAVAARSQNCMAGMAGGMASQCHASPGAVREQARGRRAAPAARDQEVERAGLVVVGPNPPHP